MPELLTHLLYAATERDLFNMAEAALPGAPPPWRPVRGGPRRLRRR